ncbi:MAG: elongation factor G [Bdellovibrionota bacterium]|jgi:elongation factor G
MQTYQTIDLRNIALVGHGSCGKTSLSEAMLVCTGVIDRMGTIEAGNTISDYHDDEKARQISISTGLLNLEWNNKKINLLDTPGYSDFIGEAISALTVSDCALVIINAGQGVQVGTEQLWQRAEDKKMPIIAAITGLDKEHADYEAILTEAKKTFGNKLIPMLIPLNQGVGFNQVADVIRKKILTFKTDGSGQFEESALPADLQETINKYHQDLVEYVAESDDSLMEKFFDQGGLSEDELKDGLHTAFQTGSFVPVYPIAGRSNIGVVRMLDFITKYGTSPLDNPSTIVTDGSTENVELEITDPRTALYIFKTSSEAHIGEVSYFRVLSGKVSTGMDLLNSTQQKPERLGQVAIVCGKNRTSVDELSAGDIGSTVKLKVSKAGDTLCDQKSAIIYPAIEYPAPNMGAALKAKSKSDEDKIGLGLAALKQEDPTFNYFMDSETKQTVITGQGELHLQVAMERLKARFNIDLDLIEPKIPYRETIAGKADSKYRHKKQSGGAGQFAEVWMTVEALPRGSGIEFTQTLVGQNVDRVFVPSVEKGVYAACEEGPLAGCKVVDVKINFYDGKMHPVDSKDIAFQIAGKEGFREAFMNAKPCLLEPIYNISVKVPEEYMGDVMGDISSRRGRIQGTEAEGNFTVVKGQVPQANLYQYATALRSITGGRGIFSREFSHYAEMPKEMEEKVIAEMKRDAESA